MAGLASAAVLFGYSWWAPIVLAGAWLSTHWLLRESGIWHLLVDRMVMAGGARAEEELNRLYKKLRRDEWNEYRSAIAGKGYKAVWERAR